jgi:hypothetical protein
MTPSEMSRIFSLEKFGTLYGDNSGMLRISLRVDLYMNREDQVFITNVVVTDPMWEMMASNVISSTSAVVELNAIVKIHKYKGFHEGHHFIPMVMEVHGTPKCDMDHFIKECACFFHDRRSRGYLSLFFAFNFLGNMLVLPFNML